MSLRVGDIAQQNIITIDENEFLVNAKNLMLINKLKCMIVLSGKKPLGLLFNTDFVKEFDMGMTAGRFVKEKQEELVTVNPSVKIQKIAEMISEQNLEFIPVIDDMGDIFGMVTPSDIVKDSVKSEEKQMAPEKAIIYLAMTQDREEEKYWFDKIMKMGFRAAVTQVGAGVTDLPIKLREAAIVAAIAKGVINEDLREKNAVSNAVRDLYAQVEIINRGLGGGFKIAVIRGRDTVTVAAYGKCGHALGSGPDHIFMGYSII